MHWINRINILGAIVAMTSASPASISSTAITRLYGATAEIEGKVRYQKGPNWLIWSGDGAINWRVIVAKAGEYEASLCYASKAEGATIEISVADRKLAGIVRRTRGYFHDDLINFERIPLEGKIRLAKGENAIKLLIATTGEVRFRSLELTPVATKEKINAERARARANRASTDWLARGGYGLMFHWTRQSAPRRGALKPYPEAVKEFDVQAFAQMVEETGAAHVLFTVNHADPHCPAPIKAWERIHPGWTTERDLIGELADALGKRGIRLMLYFASHTLGKLGKVSSDEYWTIHEQVLTEIGHRYGEKIAGYWFDGWYQSLEQYPNLSLERMSKLVRQGNPQRIVAYNFWIYPIETEWQEYWAAEMGGSLVKPPEARYITMGAGKGLQHQSLLFADAPWVHSKPDTEMEAPLFQDDKLIEYVKACLANQGVVTINLGIFQDGRIGEATLKQMQALRRSIHGK